MAIRGTTYRLITDGVAKPVNPTFDNGEVHIKDVDLFDGDTLMEVGTQGSRFLYRFQEGRWQAIN